MTPAEQDMVIARLRAEVSLLNRFVTYLLSVSLPAERVREIIEGCDIPETGEDITDVIVSAAKSQFGDLLADSERRFRGDG